MQPLLIDLSYNIETAETRFKDSTDVRREAIPDLIWNYARTQMGAGPDTRQAVDRTTYEIQMAIDLEDDSFRVTHNCGNDALCLAILVDIAQNMAARQPTV